MPKLYNVDHQHAILDAETSVAPGKPHDFSDEQIAAGVCGRWSVENPRAGLDAEREWKRLRDASRAELDAEASVLGVDPTKHRTKESLAFAIRARLAAATEGANVNDADADEPDSAVPEDHETTPAEPEKE